MSKSDDEKLALLLIKCGAIPAIMEDVLDRAKCDVVATAIDCQCNLMAWHRDALVACITAERWIFGKPNGQEKWMEFERLCEELHVDPDTFRELTRSAVKDAKVKEATEWQRNEELRRRTRYLPAVMQHSYQHSNQSTGRIPSR